MKRFMSMVLVFCFLVSFVGCGQKETVVETTSDIIIGGATSDTVIDGDDTASNSESGGYTSNNSSGSKTESNGEKQTALSEVKADLKGAEINIITFDKSLFPNSKGSTAYSKAKYETLNQIQKNLNCKVSISVATTDTIVSTLLKKQLAGEKYADIIAIRGYSTVGSIKGKGLSNLRENKSLDLSKNYMNFANCLNGTNIKGKNYCLITEDIAFGSNQGVFFNKSILSELGYSEDYIYDLAKNNKWTLDVMRQLAKKAVLDKDGKEGLSTSDRFGMLVIDAVCAGGESILAAVGAKMLINKNGNITYNMDSTEVLNAITLARDTYLNDGSAYATTSNNQELIDMFKTGRGLFLVSNIYNADDISDMDSDFGFVPFPSVKGGTYSGYVNWNIAVFSIPSGLSEKDASNAGHFLQAYCAAGSDCATIRYNETATRYFRDDTAGQYIKTANQAQQFEISSILCPSSLWKLHCGTYKIMYNTILKKDVSIKSEIDSAKSMAIAELNDFLNNQ